MSHGLGRIHSEDPEDAGFPMQAVVPSSTDRMYRNWYSGGWWGDQGDKPHCVAFSWTHFLEDGPITHKKVPAPLLDPAGLYAEAQTVVEWEGENYDGTSVRAGAKVLQARGLIGEYRWAWDAETIVRAVLETGPVVVGTNWYSGMFYPDKNGLLRLTGNVVGGHAYLINGANRNTGRVRVKNSWGREWGRNGFAALTFEDLNRLIRENGEAVLAVENHGN